jgi:DNA modification methylase
MRRIDLATQPSVLKVNQQKVIFSTSENMSMLKSGTVDFVMTSPPYWNLKNYGSDDEIGKEPYLEYLDRMQTVWDECYRVSKENAVLVINVANRRNNKVFYPIGMDIAQNMKGWKLWDIVIWYIPNALPQPNHYIEKLFDNKYEFLLVFTKDGNTDYEFHKPRVPQKYINADPREHKRNLRGRCLGNIIRIPAYRPPNIKEMGYHVAAYPEELVSLMLEAFTSPGQTILDPFLGSGTTLKVANGMERKGVGFELNSDFRDLIEKRIQEKFEVPDWKDLDIIHSSTMIPGSSKPRKAHLRDRPKVKKKVIKISDQPTLPDE